MTRSIPLDAAIAEAEKSGFLSIEDLQRLASPQPANPAQVTDAMVEAGHGGLSPARQLYVDKDEVRAILTAAIGAGEQAVADERTERKIDLWFFRDLSDEQRLSLFSIFGFPIHEIDRVHGHQRKALRHILSSLSQPRPADERVVEALHNAKVLLKALTGPDDAIAQVLLKALTGPDDAIAQEGRNG